MRDKELYTQILGIQTPWEVSDIELDMKAGEVKVTVKQKPGTKQECPKCGASCSGYDKRRRQWRHLDTCQLKTLLVADLPRVQCAEHGVVSVHVPWSEPGSGFTALYVGLNSGNKRVFRKPRCDVSAFAGMTGALVFGLSQCHSERRN